VIDWIRGAARFVAAMAASLLPRRHWDRLPPAVPVEMGAFASGIASMLTGAAIGIPAFIDHAHQATSLGIDAMLHRTFTDPNAGYSQGLVQGFSGLSIFTFLLLTPVGWLTLYLVTTGTVRGLAAYFDDPVGDPVLTAIDAIVSGRLRNRRTRTLRADREALEGPEIPDRVVSAAAAGIPDCDFAIVSSRRKEGWERGVAVFTQDGCYRIGEPVERTIHGRLRTLYPLTAHRDFEAVRRSVRYELPPDFTR
jgi:hypothetical protein